MIVLQTNWVIFLIIFVVLLYVFISQSTDKSKAKNQIRNSSDEFEKKKLKQIKLVTAVFFLVYPFKSGIRH